MEWYSVKLLYRIVITGEPDKSTVDVHCVNADQYFEERVLLVRADSSDHAYVLASNIAKSDYDSYVNKYGQTVTWLFDRTIDCFRMTDSPGSFAKVYSSIFMAGKGRDAERLIQKKYDSCPADRMHLLRRR